MSILSLYVPFNSLRLDMAIVQCSLARTAISQTSKYDFSQLNTSRRREFNAGLQCFALITGNTSVVVLFVLCLGVELLCCLHLLYIFIFLVKFG